MTRARDNAFNPSNDQSAGKNLIINGGFDIWQRGTSFTTDAAATVIYTADRISAFALFPGAGATQTITRETSSSHVPSNFKYSLKSVVSTAVPVNAGRMLIGYTMENTDSLALAGRTVTYSMQIKAIGNIDRVYLYSRYNTSGGNALSGAVDGSNAPFIINSSSFTTITWTTTVPSAATLTSTGTYGFQLVYYRANNAVEAIGDGIYIAGLQLETGNVVTSFSRAGGTIGGELALCQRYYWRETGFQSSGGVQSAFDNNVWFSLQNFNPVPMRATPTAFIENTPYIADFQSNIRTITSVNVVTRYAIAFTYSSTKLTTSSAYGLNFSDAGRALSFSSEL
jgi:hypothetical protein